MDRKGIGEISAKAPRICLDLKLLPHLKNAIKELQLAVEMIENEGGW